MKKTSLEAVDGCSILKVHKTPNQRKQKMMMMRMKNISLLTSIFFFLISIGVASAVSCSNPIIYNNIGFAVSNCGFPGSLCQFLVSSTNNQNAITNYTMSIQNVNSIPETVTLQPSSNLVNYVSPVTITVPASSTLFFNMEFWTGGSSIFGPSYTIGVAYDCGSGPSPNLINIPLEIDASGGFGDPTQPMPSLSYTSGTSVTTTTTTTTSSVPAGGTVIFNQNGCSFPQIVCPSNYSSCSYQFTRNGNIFPTIVTCDSFNLRNNPGTLNSGQSLCHSYDNGGFGSAATCTVIGFRGSDPQTTSTTTSSTTTTSTTSTTTTTPQTSTTTTTPPSGLTTIFDSLGCVFSSIACPSNYSSCSYQFTKSGNIYPGVISCDSFNIQNNPGTLKSGQSLCPSYDGSKGFSSAIRCQLFGNGGTSTSTTSSTTSTTTTTPQSSTTTTSPPSGATVFSQNGCSFPQIICPSNYASCSYQFTKNGNIFPTIVTCDSFNLRNNPGTLNSGQSLCPLYDNNGFSSAINCTVVGKSS